MAEPTEINAQITDAVAQANVDVLGVSPARALSALHMALSHSSAIAAINATSAQQ